MLDHMAKTEGAVAQLGHAVARRRRELGLSQIDVWQAGGPSNSTLTRIENGEGDAPNAATLRKLDTALSWEPGSAARALAGQQPIPRGMPASDAETDGSQRAPDSSTSRRKQHFGAWSLGPELMVRLDLAADEVEFMANTTSGYTEEDDITAVIDDLENLVYAVDELLPVLRAVTEFGVGGASHLAIEKAKEQARRKTARAAKMQADAESALERKGKHDEFGRPLPPEGLEYHKLPPASHGVLVSERLGESQDLTANAHPTGPDRWPSGEPVYDKHWDQWKAWQSAGAPIGAWEAFRASGTQQAYDLAQRFVDRRTDAELRHAAQDDAAEAPDSEGPEGGA